MILQCTYGIHTFSVGMVLTYLQFREIKVALEKKKALILRTDYFEKNKVYFSGLYADIGIKLFLYEIPGKLYRIRIQIEPCRVLGSDNPLDLYEPNKKTYRQLVKQCDGLLEAIHVPLSIDAMKISRADGTENIEFSSLDELHEYLRILKKGSSIPHYNLMTFHKKEGKAKDPVLANRNSFCIASKSATFLAYNKTAQLNMIERCYEPVMDQNVLRLEAELKRPALKNKLGKSAMEDNYKILKTLANKTRKILRWYLQRLLPACERYVPYPLAVALIETVKKKKMRERMLYLLRKASDCDCLTKALEKLRNKFDLSKNQCKWVLKKFSKIGISPITLAQGSGFQELPAFMAVI